MLKIFFLMGMSNQYHIVQQVQYFAWEQKPEILKGCQVEIAIDLYCAALESRYKINNNNGQCLLNTSFAPGTAPST